MKRKPQPEAGIKRTIKEYLEWQRPAWTVFLFQEGPFGTRGVADLLAIRDGRYLWLEIKSATGKLSPTQVEFRAKIEMAGGEYYIVRSLEDLQKLGVRQGKV